MMARGKSTIKSGRTITERRERLETANERAAARKKDKRKNRFRVGATIFVFIGLAAILVGLYLVFNQESEKTEYQSETTEIAEEYQPTIEIIDEDGTAYGGKITSRMSEYIGQVEVDFRELGYNPIRAIVPANSVREVDFYVEGYNGYIKMLIDRGAGVSVEDADRMIRYLKSIDKTDFTYIDVRVEGKAFWK